MLCLPIFPNDIFTITNKDVIGCPDKNCEKFLLNKKGFNSSKECPFLEVDKSNHLYFML